MLIKDVENIIDVKWLGKYDAALQFNGCTLEPYVTALRYVNEQRKSRLYLNHDTALTKAALT
jgi:hypothetical protein